MVSRYGKKSPGMRMLWLPGRSKSHPKGRYSSTNKQVSYTTGQKKSQVWSLGGSKAQQSLLQADPDLPLLDGPSTSGLSTLTGASSCATTVVAAAASTECLQEQNYLDTASENSALNNNIIINSQVHSHSPTTPNSSASTAPLISPPQSPLEQNLQLRSSTKPSINENTTTTTAIMPAQSHHQPLPVIVTSTTTAEIMKENRYSLLASKELDIYSLPSPPKTKLNSQENLHQSQITPNDSPHKMDNESQNQSVCGTPVKKARHNRNNNNNQGDVNSIESIKGDNVSDKIPSDDLDWIDELLEARNQRKAKENITRKKNFKNLDQLDGVPIKEMTNSTKGSVKEEDEEVVKCLYYTLMCCDCTIS